MRGDRKPSVTLAATTHERGQRVGESLRDQRVGRQLGPALRALPTGEARASQLTPDGLPVVAAYVNSPTLGQVFDQLKPSVPGLRVDWWCYRDRAAVVVCLDADAAVFAGNCQADRALRVTRRVGDELSDQQLCVTEGVLTSARRPQFVLDEAPCLGRAPELRGESRCGHRELGTPYTTGETERTPPR